MEVHNGAPNGGKISDLRIETFLTALLFKFEGVASLADFMKITLQLKKVGKKGSETIIDRVNLYGLLQVEAAEAGFIRQSGEVGNQTYTGLITICPRGKYELQDSEAFTLTLDAVDADGVQIFALSVGAPSNALRTVRVAPVNGITRDISLLGVNTIAIPAASYIEYDITTENGVDTVLQPMQDILADAINDVVLVQPDGITYGSDNYHVFRVTLASGLKLTPKPGQNFDVLLIGSN